MVEKLVYSIVDGMIDKEVIANEQKADYVYALICQVESFITIGTVMAISIIIGKFIPTVVFLAFFLGLRRRAGGYHMESYWKCYIGTIGIYISLLFFSCILMKHPKLTVLLYLLAIIIIVLIGPVNHPNMHMDSTELYGAKRLLRGILSVETVIIVMFQYKNVNIEIVIYAILGVIVCAVLLAISKLGR